MGFGLNWVTIGLDMVGWVLYMGWIGFGLDTDIDWFMGFVLKFRKTIEESEILDEVD
jgi:hypothetical protein